MIAAGGRPRKLAMPRMQMAAYSIAVGYDPDIHSAELRNQPCHIRVMILCSGARTLPVAANVGRIREATMGERSGLLDFGDYPHIHCDGVGDIQYINGETRLFLFRWRRLDLIWRPVTVASISAPSALVSTIEAVKPLIERALTVAPGGPGDHSTMLH